MIKVICIKDCTSHFYNLHIKMGGEPLDEDCILENSCNKNILYYAEEMKNTKDYYSIYSNDSISISQQHDKGIYESKNFILMSEYRQNRINNILK